MTASTTSRLYSWFIYIAIICVGIVFIFLVPPFQKPDEIVQFYKSVAVARGQLYCRTGTAHPSHTIPKYLYDFPQQLLTVPLMSRDQRAPIGVYKTLLTESSYDTTIVSEPSSCPVNPLFFLPSALAQTIPVHLNANPFIVFYSGRVAIFLTSFLIFLYAMKTVPSGYKWTVVIVYSLPMTLNQITAYNKDALHIAFGLLAFSLYMKLVLKKQKIHLHEFLLFFTSILIVILTRWQYVFFLFLLIDRRYVHLVFKKTGVQHLKAFLGIAMPIVLVLGIIVSKTILPNIHTLTFKSHVRYVYPLEQAQLLATQPLSVASLFSHTLEQKGDYYFKSLIGQLGWLEVELPLFIYFGYAALLGIIVYKMSLKILPNKKELLRLFLVCGLTLCCELLSFYIYWTAVGSSIVEGIQGRYFITMLPFALVGTALFLRTSRKLALFLGCAVGLYLTMNTIYRRYYDYSSFYFSDETYQYPNKVLTITDSTQTKVHLQNDKKFTGIALIPSLSSAKVTVPYEVFLKDENCLNSIDSQLLVANRIRPSEYVELIFNTPIITDLVCLEFRPLFVDHENQSSLSLQDETLQHRSIIRPIYRF